MSHYNGNETLYSMKQIYCNEEVVDYFDDGDCDEDDDSDGCDGKKNHLLNEQQQDYLNRKCVCCNSATMHCQHNIHSPSSSSTESGICYFNQQYSGDIYSPTSDMVSNGTDCGYGSVSGSYYSYQTMSSMCSNQESYEHHEQSVWLEGYLSDLILKAYNLRRQPKHLLDYKCSLQETITRCLSAYLTERFKIYLIGSSLTCVGSGRSDVDLCMVIYDRKGKVDERYNDRVCAEMMLEKISIILEKCSMALNSKVIRGNVPILKFYDLNHVEVNLNLNKLVSVQNTMLLMHCCSLDSRVAPFLFTVKLWAHKNGINCAYFKSLSSYSLSLMALFFLQNVCQPPILPPFGNILESIKSSAGLFYFQPTRNQKRNSLIFSHMFVTSSNSQPSTQQQFGELPLYSSINSLVSHHPNHANQHQHLQPHPHHSHYHNHSKSIAKVSYVHSGSLSTSPTSTCSSSSDGENVSETSSQSSNKSLVQLNANVPAAMAMAFAAAQTTAKEATHNKTLFSDDDDDSKEKLPDLNYFALCYQYCMQKKFQSNVTSNICKNCNENCSKSNNNTATVQNEKSKNVICDKRLYDKLAQLNLSNKPQTGNTTNGESMDSTIEPFRSFNKQSLGNLFANFINYYSNISVYDSVLSVRTGKLMNRTDPIFARSAHTSMDTFICVEEPFNHTNTSHSVHNDFMFNFIVKSFHWTRDSVSRMKLSMNDLV